MTRTHDDQEVAMQRDRTEELAVDETEPTPGDLTNARPETGPVDTGTIEASPADVAEQRTPADPDDIAPEDMALEEHAPEGEEAAADRLLG
jgi:hypothetical protein